MAFITPYLSGTPGSCRYCGRKSENNAGDLYHGSSCEGKWCRAQLEIAQRCGCSVEVEKAWVKRIEQADYVGD